MRDEKFKLYDMAFFVGLLSTVAVFATLNVISYRNAVAWINEYNSRGANFGEMQPIWGFPYNMTNPLTFAINILIIAFCGLVMGLIFRFIWSKFQEKSLK